MHDMKQFLAVLSSLVVTLGHVSHSPRSRKMQSELPGIISMPPDTMRALPVLPRRWQLWNPRQKRRRRAMRGFDAKDHERDRGALNAAGTLSLIRARILEKQGHEREGGRCISAGRP
jgi:hypothetical protein